jgi:addiction module HigA family antidote
MGKLKPVTPGELLREEFLAPLGLSQYRLAKEIGVPAQRIGEIAAGRRAITADTDLRLCRFFGPSNGYCLRAPAYDTEVAQEALSEELAIIKPSQRGDADQEDESWPLTAAKWIQIADIKEGGLRETLGMKPGAKVTAKDIAEAKRMGGKATKRASLAKTFRKMGGKR